MFIVNFGQDHLGLSHSGASWGVSAIGGASAVGRVLIGLFGDVFARHRLSIFFVSLWINGAMAILLAAVSNFASLIAVCVLFGLSAGSFAALAPLLIEEYTSGPDVPRVCAAVHEAALV